HEAMVRRLSGDIRVPTNFIEELQIAMLANPDPFTRLLGQKEDVQQDLRDAYRHKEYITAKRGQEATVRVDAMPEVSLPGRVRSVAAVASQADLFMSDVKVYQTLVLIEQKVDGLKPDMNAEVTIHINDIKNV